MNTLSQVLTVPVCLIMKAPYPNIEVIASSSNINNPFNRGQIEKMAGTYCETVIKSKKKLNVPNSLLDPIWDNNPYSKNNLISYIGFPLLWPNGEVFGTICALDSIDNNKFRQIEYLDFNNNIDILSR